MRVLLAAGAAVNTAYCRNYRDWTPLMLAARGQIHYCDGDSAGLYSIELGGNCCGQPPITWSPEPPEVLSIVQQLLDVGADVGAATSGGWTALHCAANQGLSKACGMLVAAGAPLNGFHCYGRNPLMAAVTGWVRVYKDYRTTRSQLIDTNPQHLAVVQQLLQAEAAVDAADTDGKQRCTVQQIPATATAMSVIKAMQQL